MKLDLALGRCEIVQAAYVVPDIEAAAQAWARLGVGPFLHIPSQADVTYRGDPAHLNLTLAFGQAGDLQIELIQQHDDAPSVYRDLYPAEEGGHHHYAVFATDYDADLAALNAAGFETVMALSMPGGARIAYADLRPKLPFMLELFEEGPVIRGLFQASAAAAQDWDGSDPYRPLAPAS